MLESFFLGLLQGVTEFLPISSSGHLALAQNYFGIELGPDYDVILHFGTFLATIIYFKKQILDADRNLIKHILIGSIPAALLGLLFKDYIFLLFKSNASVGLGLLFTSIMLWSTRAKKSDEPLTNKKSLLIGLAQAIAMVPGVSRSGSTISTSLLSGLSQSKAFTFSFLLSLPAILGAQVVNLKDITLDPVNYPLYAVGITSAFISGLISLKLLHKIMNKALLHKFAYYTLALAILALTVL